MRVLCAFLNTETPWCEDWKIFSVGVPAWGLWSVGGNRDEFFFYPWRWARWALWLEKPCFVVQCSL